MAEGHPLSVLPPDDAASACPKARSCEWSEHDEKHFPKRGVTREKTLRGPAKYLPGTTAERIRELETFTVMTPDRTEERAHKRHYFRRSDEVIGWDKGELASNSFVECSGGEVSGRSFHGRPMHPSNKKWQA